MNEADKEAVVQENKRRRTVMDEYSKKPLERAVFADRVPGGPDGTGDVGVCLYNVSHVGRSPLPKDSLDPAVRLLGIFKSNEDAIGHARKMAAKCEIDYWITPVGQWFMMHVDRSQDQLKTQEFIEARLEKHKQRRDRDFEQLKTAHENKLQSKTSYQKNERDKRRAAAGAKSADGATGADSAKGADGAKRSSVMDVTQHFLQVGQRFAVISVLADGLQSTRIGKKLPEPILRVYGAFDSKKLAKSFISDVLSPHIGDFDIDIVDMYSWLHPQTIHLQIDQIDEQFRDPEIDKIMKHAKEEKKNSKAFRERCALMDKEPDMPHVTGRDTGATFSLAELADAEAEPESEAVPKVSDEDFSFLKDQAEAFYKSLASSPPDETSSSDAAESPAQTTPALSDL